MLVSRRSLPGRNLDGDIDAWLSIFTCHLFFFVIRFFLFAVFSLFLFFFVLVLVRFFFPFLFRRSRTRSMVNGEVSGMRNLANDRLRYGILGDVYGRVRPVDFLNAHVVQFLEGSQSVVSHFQR